ncbi:MAG TPA: hypothetical protein VGM92_08065 [Candidatus Kapabacteria bacterium]|jgi:hypothetical protein
MKAIHFIAALLLVTTSVALTGCYTQVAGTRDYYGGRVYRVPSYSDTIHADQAVRYDTTMHGDTMFIDEHPADDGVAANTGGGGANDETIVNNYGTGTYWDGLCSPGFSVSFGWPYYSWYSPWEPYYTCDYGWGYPGFYPPVYDAWGFGYRPYYAYGFYGGYHSHGYGNRYFANNQYGRYGYGRTATGGRFGGESRHASGSRSGIGSSPSSMATADRNAPVHVMAPEGGAMSRGSMAQARQPGGMSTMSAGSRQVVVRRSGGQVTSMSMSNRGGHQMVVVRRGGSSAGGNAYRSYGSGNYSGRSSGRSSSTARSYGTGRGYSSGSGSNGSGSRGSGGGSSGRASSGGGGGRR